MENKLRKGYRDNQVIHEPVPWQVKYPKRLYTMRIVKILFSSLYFVMYPLFRFMLHVHGYIMYNDHTYHFKYILINDMGWDISSKEMVSGIF